MTGRAAGHDDGEELRSDTARGGSGDVEPATIADRRGVDDCDAPAPAVPRLIRVRPVEEKSMWDARAIGNSDSDEHWEDDELDDEEDEDDDDLADDDDDFDDEEDEEFEDDLDDDR